MAGSLLLQMSSTRLSSGRAYKEAWEEERVIETMNKERGGHFDPEILDTFISVLDVIRNIMHLYPDKTEENVRPRVLLESL